MKTRGAAKKTYNISDKSQWSQLEALSVQNGGRGEESDGEGLVDKVPSQGNEVIRLFSPLQCRAITAHPNSEKSGVQANTYKICTRTGIDGAKCGSSECKEENILPPGLYRGIKSVKSRVVSLDEVDRESELFLEFADLPRAEAEKSCSTFKSRKAAVMPSDVRSFDPAHDSQKWHGMFDMESPSATCEQTEAEAIQVKIGSLVSEQLKNAAKELLSAEDKDQVSLWIGTLAESNDSAKDLLEELIKLFNALSPSTFKMTLKALGLPETVSVSTELILRVLEANSEEVDHVLINGARLTQAEYEARLDMQAEAEAHQAESTLQAELDAAKLQALQYQSDHAQAARLLAENKLASSTSSHSITNSVATPQSNSMVNGSEVGSELTSWLAGILSGRKLEIAVKAVEEAMLDTVDDLQVMYEEEQFHQVFKDTPAVVVAKIKRALKPNSKPPAPAPVTVTESNSVLDLTRRLAKLEAGTHSTIQAQSGPPGPWHSGTGMRAGMGGVGIGTVGVGAANAGAAEEGPIETMVLRRAESRNKVRVLEANNSYGQVEMPDLLGATNLAMAGRAAGTQAAGIVTEMVSFAFKLDDRQRRSASADVARPLKPIIEATYRSLDEWDAEFMDSLQEVYYDLKEDLVRNLTDLGEDAHWTGTHPAITKLDQHYQFWHRLTGYLRHVKRHTSSERKALMYGQQVIVKAQKIRQKPENSVTKNLALHRTDVELYDKLLLERFDDSMIKSITVESTDPVGTYLGPKAKKRNPCDDAPPVPPARDEGRDEGNGMRPRCPHCNGRHKTSGNVPFADCYRLNPLVAPLWWREKPSNQRLVVDARSKLDKAAAAAAAAKASN
jgi:hypothetical protein